MSMMTCHTGLFLCLLGSMMVAHGQALDAPSAPKPPLQPVKPAVPPPAIARPLPALQQPSQPRPLVRPNVTPGAPATQVTGADAAATAIKTPPNSLVWDQEVKEITADSGATNALITFSFTNSHSSEVLIRSVRPSCGCTTVQLPSLPWHIPPGSNGQITASLDLRGKRGVLTKSLSVDSTSGFKSLLFKVTIPAQLVTTTASGESIDPDRVHNMQMAMVDRQVVFRNQDCAKCHLEPAVGKMGEELYNAACAICHNTPNRATMVPDLTALTFPTSVPYWKYWIVNGRPGSLMPAFAQDKGGPLTNEQIDSLVEYLNETITLKSKAAADAKRAAPTAPGIQRGARPQVIQAVPPPALNP